VAGTVVGGSTSGLKTYCIRVPDAGCLDRGIANPRGESAQQAATRNATLGWFRELEPAAGVSQADGRGWYGLRRILMDNGTEVHVERDEPERAGRHEHGHAELGLPRPGVPGGEGRRGYTYERIRTGGRVSGSTPAPNLALVNPVLAKELSVYTPEEIRSAIAHLEAQRAARQAASKQVSSTVNPVEKGTRWTPRWTPKQRPGSTTWIRAWQVPI